MYQYCELMNVHGNSKLFFELFHILFTIHGGTTDQKVQSSGPEMHTKSSGYVGASLWTKCIFH